MEHTLETLSAEVRQTQCVLRHEEEGHQILGLGVFLRTDDEMKVGTRPEMVAHLSPRGGVGDSRQEDKNPLSLWERASSSIVQRSAIERCRGDVSSTCAAADTVMVLGEWSTSCT
jgi:hypothetical protein